MEAEHWLTQRLYDLNPDEEHFIKESAALRDREQTARERLRRWVTLAAVVAAGVFLILTGLAGLQWWREDQQCEITVLEREKALSRQLAAQALNYLDKQFDLALLLSLESYNIRKSLEARGSLLSGLLHDSHITTFLRGHRYSVMYVAFSLDDKRLFSGSLYGGYSVWDVVTGEQLIHIETGAKNNTAGSVAFSQDGKYVAFSMYDGTIQLWDVTTGQQRGKPLSGHKDHVVNVVFSPDGNMLASGGSDNTLILWNVETGELQRRITPSRKSEMTIDLWNMAEDYHYVGQLSTDYSFNTGDIAFSPDGTMLASTGNDGLDLWDVATKQRIHRWSEKKGILLSGLGQFVSLRMVIY